METLTTNTVPWARKDKTIYNNIKAYLINRLIIITMLFTLSGKLLQFLDPAAGILDIGIFTVGIFGLLVGVAAILCSLWLQELLWQPFNAFRKNIQSHFNRLSSWQQCILYFSVFFLMLYAVIVAVGVVM